VPSCRGFCSGCSAVRFFLFGGVLLDVLAARFLAAIPKLSGWSTNGASCAVCPLTCRPFVCSRGKQYRFEILITTISYDDNKQALKVTA